MKLRRMALALAFLLLMGGVAWAGKEAQKLVAPEIVQEQCDYTGGSTLKHAGKDLRRNEDEKDVVRAADHGRDLARSGRS